MRGRISFWRKFMCAAGMHKRLQVIQTFGAAQHVGCPYCEREFAIHHGMRVVVPWDSDFSELYEDMGYDTRKARAAWRGRLSQTEI